MQDLLPPNTTYVSGGTLVGERVEWTIPNLAGYGGVAEETLVVAANAGAGTTILNDTYSAQAYSGQYVSGTLTATTRIVDTYVWLSPWEAYTLTYGGPDVTTVITLPIGVVTEATTLAYEELDQAVHPLALSARTLRRSFRLTAFRANRFVPNLRATDSFSVVLTLRATLGGLAATGERLQLYRWDRGSGGQTASPVWTRRQTIGWRVRSALRRWASLRCCESRHDVYLPLVRSGYKPY